MIYILQFSLWNCLRKSVLHSRKHVKAKTQRNFLRDKSVLRVESNTNIMTDLVEVHSCYVKFLRFASLKFVIMIYCMDLN